MSRAGAFEEGQRVEVANVQNVALIEVGTGTVLGKIVGIHEVAVEPVRRIVDGMAIGISHA